MRTLVEIKQTLEQLEAELLDIFKMLPDFNYDFDKTCIIELFEDSKV